jgi:hypothetical protein
VLFYGSSKEDRWKKAKMRGREINELLSILQVSYGRLNSAHTVASGYGKYLGGAVSVEWS